MLLCGTLHFLPVRLTVCVTRAPNRDTDGSLSLIFAGH